MAKGSSKEPRVPPSESEAEREFRRLFEGSSAAAPSAPPALPKASTPSDAVGLDFAADEAGDAPAEATRELSEAKRRLRLEAQQKEREAERLYGLWKEKEEQLKRSEAAREVLVTRLEKAEEDLACALRESRREEQRARAESKGLREQLKALTSRSLAELLEALQLKGEGEAMQLLGCLLSEAEGRALLAAWVIPDPPRFERWVAAKLLRWCGASDCVTDHPREWRIEVEQASRCQRCQGSKRRRLAHRLLELCEQRGIRRVVVAGGSPNYRDQLNKLLGEGLTLSVVLDEDGQSARQRAHATASADLVVVWGATETSHSFTNSFIAAGAEPTLCLRSRGLESMLEELISRLDAT